MFKQTAKCTPNRTTPNSMYTQTKAPSVNTVSNDRQYDTEASQLAFKTSSTKRTLAQTRQASRMNVQLLSYLSRTAAYTLCNKVRDLNTVKAASISGPNLARLKQNKRTRTNHMTDHLKPTGQYNRKPVTELVRQPKEVYRVETNKGMYERPPRKMAIVCYINHLTFWMYIHCMKFSNKGIYIFLLSGVSNSKLHKARVKPTQHGNTRTKPKKSRGNMYHSSYTLYNYQVIMVISTRDGFAVIMAITLMKYSKFSRATKRVSL